MSGRDDVARTVLATVRIINGTAALLVPETAVLLRHHPELRPAVSAIGNAFQPWRRTTP